MDTTLSTNHKSKRMFANILSIFVILTMAFPATSVANAAPLSPFVGKWEAVDVDGSDMNLAIGGPATGPFQITWMDKYISFCDGEAGIVRGTGWLGEGDSNLLEADVLLECFTTGATLDFHVTFRYHPATNMLSVRWWFGQVTIWHHPGGGQVEEPPTLGLRVNYGHDWVESFYEGGHVAWISVTDGDGNLKATAELVTEPKDYWGGETGFQSLDGVWFDADGNQMDNPPDIQPYDWVFGWVDNGASAQVQIGDIQGAIDLETDSIRGTVLADWFAEELYIICDPWGLSDISQYRESSVYPDGIDEYECSWSGVLDFELGQELGVWYYGSDGHAVVNAFSTSGARIHASVTSDFFFATDFNPGTLSISIYESVQEDAALLWRGEVDTDESGFVHIGPDVHGLDLMPENYLVISDGRILKGLVLDLISLDVFDTEHDIMAGTAPAGSEVMVVAAPGPEWEVQTILNVLADPETGAWLADFSSIGFDITEEMRGWSFASIFDEDGDTNETSSLPPPPNPRFVVFPEWEWFDGNDWPDGATVDITVEGNPECTTSKESWGYFFDGSFGAGCDVAIGDVVTFTDGATTRTHTVRSLAITNVDKRANTVTGTANEGEVVYAWVHGFGETEMQLTAENGIWLADFDLRDFDLVEGTCGRSEIRDEFGNSTAVDWCVPNPRFSVFPEWEYIEGWEWPDGATVYATIDGKPACSVEEKAGYPEWDPIAFVPMWFPEGCDAVVGDVVTLTDNVTTRQHTIQNLAVTGVNADEDTVSGTANAGAQVHVWPHGYNELLPTADVDGNWTADFTETGPDLVGGMAGRTEVRDELGNATAVEWGVPVTLFVTGTEDAIANDGVCTLREAVIAAKTNAPSGEVIGECPAGSEFATDTILLAANQTYSLTMSGSDEDGAYTGDLDILDNSAAMDLIIAVEGNGTATVSQEASVDDRVLEIHGATVQIEGLTLTGGGNVEIGGGVHNVGGTLIMNVSTVSGNMANYGGGIYNDPSGTLILTGGTVSRNTANVDGGGLENGGTLTVDASTFIANSATYGGGALFTYTGTVTIQNGSVFGGDPNAGQGNTANYGGGIAVWSGNLMLVNSTISGNTVSWVGGGIRNGAEGTVTVNDSTISGNSAGWDGGGILNEGTMTLEDSEVSDNTATYQGGGIGNFEGDLTITASTVSGNSSGDGGGAVNWPNGTLMIDASAFTNNTAGGGGGLRNQGTATIKNGSQFIGNTVSWMGGGINNDSGGILLVEGSSMVSSNSSDGFAGGLHNDPASTLTVNDSTIASNVSVYGGGGIMNEGALTVENSVLSGNTSGQGGGLYNPGTATIINTTVGGSGAGKGNIGTDGGGGLFNVGTMTVNDSFVVGNDGTTYGGGLFNWIGGMLTISNSTVSGNAANEGGGLHNKEGSTAIIQNGSIFSGNYARFSVGGIQNWGTITITDSVLRENMSPGDDGDAIANTGPEGSTVSITASCIVGNGDTAVFNALPVLLNATGNWWGDASGPFHPIDNPLGLGDSVSDFLDFSSWLIAPPAICTP